MLCAPWQSNTLRLSVSYNVVSPELNALGELCLYEYELCHYAVPHARLFFIRNAAGIQLICAKMTERMSSPWK